MRSSTTCLFGKLMAFAFIFSGFSVFGQIPAGYYDNAQGLSGEPLRTALFQIIDNHNSQSYNSLWGHFSSTDQQVNGDVWDMYSDDPTNGADYTYTFGSDQCGNYSAEGDCYNREHSFPKSWFNDQSPMNSDLFHLYPTDGYVNGQRNNYPYGEVAVPAWTSTNGSKRGFCSYPGYTGNAFEPIDEYKGDFARTYFYMMTRYKNNVGSWSSAMLSGDNLAQWATNMLVEWSTNDPVSQKEIDRNNAVYQIQNNRNPYIDHPEWITEIWMSTVSIEQNQLLEATVWYNNNQLSFYAEKQLDRVVIYNMIGEEVLNEKITNENAVSFNLPQGVYIAHLIGTKGEELALKFVK